MFAASALCPRALLHPNIEPRGRTAGAAADYVNLPFSFVQSPKT
jgi:hypothetical protein